MRRRRTSEFEGLFWLTVAVFIGAPLVVVAAIGLHTLFCCM